MNKKKEEVADAAEADAPKAGDDKVQTVKVRAPEFGGTSASWNGEVFEADKDGVFTIPVVALADLANHGFTRV